MRNASTLSLTKLVAFLAHPYVDLPQELEKLQLGKKEIAYLFSLSKSNKVLYRILSHNNARFPTKLGFIEKLIERSNSFRNSHDNALKLKEELLDIVAKFNSQGIDNVFIKSLNTLPLDSDNFDILVSERDLTAAIKVLRNAGFVELVFVKEPFKWLFRNVADVKSNLAIHLHTAVAWEGIRFVNADDVLMRYRKSKINGVIVGTPSPEHHILVTTAHTFFENRQFNLNDLSYIIEDMYSDQVDWDYVTAWVANDCWSETLHGMLLLANHIYKTLFDNSLIPETIYTKLKDKRRMNQSFSLYKPYRKLALPVRIPITTVFKYYVKKIFAKHQATPLDKMKTFLSLCENFLGRRMFFRKNHPSFSVCFIGQDGTGKTTHAKFLWKELEQRGIQTKYLWSRGRGLFLYPLTRLIRSTYTHDGQENRNDYVHETLLKREPLKSLWSTIMLVDHLIQSIRVKLAVSFGSIVICDRYIFDTLVDIKCDLKKDLNLTLARIVELLASKPAVTFIMDTRPSELVRRRPDMKMNVAKKKRFAYIDHSHKRKGFYVINTCDKLQRNKNKILLATLRTLYTSNR